MLQITIQIASADRHLHQVPKHLPLNLMELLTGYTKILKSEFISSSQKLAKGAGGSVLIYYQTTEILWKVEAKYMEIVFIKLFLNKI